MLVDDNTKVKETALTRFSALLVILALLALLGIVIRWITANSQGEIIAYGIERGFVFMKVLATRRTVFWHLAGQHIS